MEIKMGEQPLQIKDILPTVEDCQYELRTSELDPPLQAGKKHELGKGTFGAVYRATYQGIPAAVKAINYQAEAGTEEGEKKLRKEKKYISRECKIMMQVQHPNLVRLFGVHLTQKTVYLVMELAERGSLYSILSNSKDYPSLSWNLRLKISLGIAQGLVGLHFRKKPILHRDLKSGNIFIRQDWSPIIGDFGVSRDQPEQDKKVTNGTGTICYMAPEIHKKQNEFSRPISREIDIFSFGMVLFELLTRRLPWSYEKLGIPQIILAIDRQERPTLPPIQKQNPNDPQIDCPEGYKELMNDCWAHDPDLRPNAKVLVQRLQTIIQRSVMDPQEVMDSQEEKKKSDQQGRVEKTLIEIIGNEEGVQDEKVMKGIGSNLKKKRKLEEVPTSESKKKILKTSEKRSMMNPQKEKNKSDHQERVETSLKIKLIGNEENDEIENETKIEGMKRIGSKLKKKRKIEEGKISKPPENQDVQRKRKLRGNMPRIHRFVRWTNEERRQLHLGIKHQNQEIIWRRVLFEMKRKKDGSGNSDPIPVYSSENKAYYFKLLQEIAGADMGSHMKLKQELDRISSIPDDELLQSTEGIDWDRIARDYVKTRSASACKVEWKR